MDSHRIKRTLHSDALIQFKQDLKTRSTSTTRTRHFPRTPTEPKPEKLNSSVFLLKSGMNRQTTPILRNLRGRNSLKEDEANHISPELAASVVRKYLLPMFESEKKDLMSKARADSMKIYKSKTAKDVKDKEVPSETITIDQWAETSRTVYGDFKLSEKLAKELEAVRYELANTSKRLKEAEQAREVTESEMKNINSKYMKSLTDQKMMLFYQNTETKLSQTSKQQFSLLHSQIINLKALYKQVRTENDKLKQSLYAERSDNDIRFYIQYFL
jgi:hypothetical protein